MSNEAMADLHSALIDANEGYEKAIDEAEDNNIRTLFEQMHEHHQRAHTDLHRALLERGERADDTGTFLSVIHRTVISVRSVVAGLDKNSLSSFADGEERIAEKYEEAIEAETDASAISMLQRHKAAQAEMISKMRNFG